MNERKRHVIKKAHQLFIDKGFQATSIQDILDYAQISKGTFYNYFSSKNELLISIFKTISEEIEKELNELLIGQDPRDLEIFIKQIELQTEKNHVNKISALFGEVFVSDDEELKQYISKIHLRMLRWIFRRFVDIFGEEKKPYLLDCTIMFASFLNHSLRYFPHSNEWKENLRRIIRYSMNRIVNIVEDVSASGEQLIPPEKLDEWLAEDRNVPRTFHDDLHRTILSLRKDLLGAKDEEKYTELLDFIKTEFSEEETPRKHLTYAVLSSLKEQPLFKKKNLEKLESLIKKYFESCKH